MRKLFAIAALAALAACSSSDTDTPTTPAQVAVKGEYSLSTVNGKPLPYVVQQDASSTRSLTAAVINLGSDGTWTQVQTYKTTGATGTSSTSTFTMFGTYKVNGTTATLSLTSSSSGTLTLTSDNTGSTLTLTDPGAVYVYTR